MSDRGLPESIVMVGKSKVRIDQEEATRILARTEGLVADEVHHAPELPLGLSTSSPAGRSHMRARLCVPDPQVRITHTSA